MHVSDLMVRGIRTCRPEDTLNDAARLLWEGGCGCLPVVSRDARVVGILTDRDVCMAAYTQGRTLKEMQVLSAASDRVVSCAPHESLAKAEAIMRQHAVRRLPVVENGGRIVGILSLNDLAREATRQRAARRPAVTDAEVGATLAAICEEHASWRSPAAAEEKSVTRPDTLFEPGMFRPRGFIREVSNG